MATKNYKTLLKDINTFIFDVDGVLTDGNILVTTKGKMLRKMHTKDGFALKVAQQAGFNVCIISGGSNKGVRHRLKGLGIKAIYLGVNDKVKQLETYLTTNDIDLDSVLYMGDDIPDYKVMKRVGLPCCPQDAVPEIKTICKYISHKKGGFGAVRDVIEQVLKVQDKWFTHFDAKYD